MKWLRSFLLIAGIVLLLLNTIGLFKSLRNEDLYAEINPYKNDISIRLSDAEKQLNEGKMNRKGFCRESNYAH